MSYRSSLIFIILSLILFCRIFLYLPNLKIDGYWIILDLKREILDMRTWGLRFFPFELLLSSLFERLNEGHVYLPAIVRRQHILLDYRCSFFDNSCQCWTLHHQLEIKVKAWFFFFKRIVERWWRDLLAKIMRLG